MKRLRLFFKSFSVAILMVAGLGCTSIHHPAGRFLENYSQLQAGKNFKQEAVLGNQEFEKFTKVKVSDVDTTHFQNPYQEYSKQEIESMAVKLKSGIEESMAKRFEVLSLRQNPDKQTLVISPSLIYATSPEWMINALTVWFIGFQFSKGSAAFEAKLFDGSNGKEIAMVAEERKGGGGILDLKSIVIGGFFRFIHAEGAFKRWGKNFDKMTSPVIQP